MRIGISCHAFGHGGGMERYTLDLASGLHELGIRPVVFSKRFDRSVPQYDWIEPVRIGTCGLPGKLRDHVFSHRLRRFRREHGIDLLIGCNRTAVTDVAICGGTHIGHLQRLAKRPTFWDRQQIALERAHYGHSRLIVAHSGLMAEELRQLYGVAETRVQVLFPPIDQGKFAPVDAPTRAALRREYGFGEDEVVFVFPSSDHVRKGLPALAAAFAASALPITLAVLGRPLDAALPRVRHLGYRADIENAYRAADYTILASRYEPFGLVGPESVLCGTPAVLARGIGCIEALGDAAVLPFDLDDPASLPASLAEAVARVRRQDARLSAPRAHLTYDPDTRAHVRAILELAGACPAVPA